MRVHRLKISGLLLCAGLTVLLAGCPPGQVPSQGRVGTTTCLGCHNGTSARDYRSYLESAHFAVNVQCEDCHGPGALHVQSVGRVGLIGNPTEGGFANSYASCIACHADTVGQFLASGHAKQEVATCSNCHTVHRANTWYLPFEDNRVCLQCHGQIEFPNDDAISAHTYHDNVPEERASLCVGCHMQPLRRNNQARGHFNHSQIPVKPQFSASAIEAGITPTPANTCAGITGCHDGSNDNAPFFDIDDLEANLRLQRIYDTRYPSESAAAARLIRGQL